MQGRKDQEEVGGSPPRLPQTQEEPHLRDELVFSDERRQLLVSVPSSPSARWAPLWALQLLRRG